MRRLGNTTAADEDEKAPQRMVAGPSRTLEIIRRVRRLVYPVPLFMRKRLVLGATAAGCTKFRRHHAARLRVGRISGRGRRCVDAGICVPELRRILLEFRLTCLRAEVVVPALEGARARGGRRVYRHSAYGIDDFLHFPSLWDTLRCGKRRASDASRRAASCYVVFSAVIGSIIVLT